MDQIKIGNFIKERRKEKKITQSELAEKLNISDRAISKWENGNCMPDSGTIPELCKILDITINDLFSGEIVDMNDNEKRLEKNLLEMVKLKEQKDKQLLSLEIFIGTLVTIILLACILVASFVDMENLPRVLIIVSGTIVFLVGMLFGLRIEQTAGYYECEKCHHKYVPTYTSVFFAMHINRTRYMKCPKCGKKSWNKKVLSKDEKRD
ncbi:MAG: helix-turn-helix domain-containing protein [Erysipelotrichales bacterium]|nr:helix-turn-helix domain-containing protein [Erysipelotrichales bacterium]